MEIFFYLCQACGLHNAVAQDQANFAAQANAIKETVFAPASRHARAASDKVAS